MSRPIFAIASIALTISAGFASAEPETGVGFVNPFNPNVSASERAAIHRSKLRLKALKIQAKADGRVTAAEKAQIRAAVLAVRRLVVNARRD